MFKHRPGMALLAATMIAASAVAAFAASSVPPPPNTSMLAVLSQLTALGGKPIETLTPNQARLQPSASDAVARLIKAKGLIPPITPVGAVADTMFRANGVDVPVRIYTPAGPGPFPVLVYYHSGGWVLADLNTYDASCRALTVGAKTIVVSVGYRLAPENKFPAAPTDAYAALLWVQKNASMFGGDPSRVSVGGESAGGNLATVTAMMARDKHTKMPIHQLLVYPVTNYAFDTPSYVVNAKAAPLNAAMMRWFFKYYLRTAADGANPYVSPLRGIAAGLPPATVITDQIDPLMSEGKAYADKLKAAGVPVAYHNYDGVTHEFFGMGALVPAAQQAVDFATTELAAANAAPPSAPAQGTGSGMPANSVMTAEPAMQPSPAAMPSGMSSPALSESPAPAPSGSP